MKLKDYISDDNTYIIPVKWEAYSTVKIYGCNNLEEAIKVAEKYQDDFPAEDGEYIDGSYMIDIQSDEDAINAQEYYHNGYDFVYKREN